MSNDATLEERCAELNAKEKRAYELLREAKELEEKCGQCQTEEWAQAREYLKEALEKQCESRALIEEFFKQATEMLEEQCSEALDELDALADD